MRLLSSIEYLNILKFIVTYIIRPVHESPNFQPYEIHLLIKTISLLITLLSAIRNKIDLGTNLVTKIICRLFHCIGEKTYLNHLWYRSWF